MAPGEYSERGLLDGEPVGVRRCHDELSGLDARDGKLSLAATDMELSLRTAVEANVESEGQVTRTLRPPA